MTEFRKWNVADSSLCHILCDKYNIHSLAGRVAAARAGGIGEKEIFSKSDFISSPFELKDMDKAAEKIGRAVEEGRKITVYGDYDADGVTATVLLYSYLEAMGADVSFYIPDRVSEGYGLNEQSVRKLAGEGCELIVTVDNGISAVNEIELAKKLGMQVVVTDHHRPQEKLPDCIVVDPHREDCKSSFKDICGAFVAFKLVAALDSGDYEGAFEQYAELVAIATLADIVPLVSENRTIVRLGLSRLEQTDNLGLRALMQVAFSQDSEINSVSVTFGIVPRINAAGRMSSASLAAQLLLTDDEQMAQELCGKICCLNETRKTIEVEIVSQIEAMFAENPLLCADRVIVVCGKNWHHGVLGIVASKMVEKTLKPVIVLSSDDQVAIGSGRSVEGFSLFDAINACHGCLKKFGGHTLAAGVSLAAENVDRFRKEINDYAHENFKYMPQKLLCADASIAADEINVEAVKELELFEPFGKDNPEPLFAIEGVTITKISGMSNGKHSRLNLVCNGLSLTAVYFGTAPQNISVFENKKADILVRLKINCYAGQQSVSVRIFDIRPSNISDRLFFSEKQLFEAALKSEPLSQKEAEYMMPSRETAAEIYRQLKAVPEAFCSADIIWWKLSGRVNRAQIGTVLLAFCQKGLVSEHGGIYCISENATKQNIFDCDIVKHISGYIKR